VFYCLSFLRHHKVSAWCLGPIRATMRGLQLLLVAAATWCPAAVSKHLKHHHLRSELSASDGTELTTACVAVLADRTPRPGTCKAVTACQAEGKQSVPGFCPGKASVQCCVSNGAGAAAGGAAGGTAGGAVLGGAAGAGGAIAEQRQPDTLDGAAGGSAAGPPPAVGGAGPAAVPGALVDAYTNAATTPTCPLARQARTVCKEIHGHTGGCGDLHDDMATCPVACQVAVKRLTLGGQNIDWVCQAERPQGGTKRGYMSDDRTSPTRDTPPAITRAQIIDNAVAWINNRIRYSQKRSHGNPAYRMDCTGFVSMSLGLPLWGTTGFVRGCLAYSGDKTIERTPCKSMQPGDAMVSQGHVVLFRKWTDQTQGTIELWEEKGTAYGTVVSHNEFSGFAAMTAAATDGIVRGRGQYFCFKRKNITP
jgi:hypothetical protein